MRRRLTRKALVALAAGGLLLLAATTAQAGWLFVLAAGVLALVVASLALARGTAKLDIVRSVPVRARLGDEITVGLRATNAGRRHSPPMRLEDHFPALEPVAVVLDPLAPREAGEVELTTRAIRRGVFDAGDVVASSGAPFGFTSKSRVVSVESRMVVVPRWVELRSFPLLEPSSFPSEALHERAVTGAGQEYMGVREYRPGDPPRHIHWRTSARTGGLAVREYEQQAQSRVALVLAGPDDGAPPDSSFEMLVSAAASIARYSLATGHPIDLLRPGSEGPEHVGDVSMAGVLDWLAGARAIDHALPPLVLDALRRIGSRGTVVLLAPTAGEAGASLEAALHRVQMAGARAMAVVARSSSWAPERRGPNEDAILRGAGGGRGYVRVVERDGELATCLAA